MKYRIVERTSGDGRCRYVVQVKALFFWTDRLNALSGNVELHGTVDLALEVINDLKSVVKANRYRDKVVQEVP